MVLLGITMAISGNNGSNGEPQSGDFADQMLAAVNAARAQARDCGGQMMPAVPALTWI